MNIEKTITSVLSETPDERLQLSLNKLNVKPLITVDGTQVSLHLCTGFPSLFLQDPLLPQLQKKLETALPNHAINIFIDHFIKAHQTQLSGKGLKGVKNTIAIASGKGGVGKSTVTVNLATALARAGARVGILDADIYGPSIPLMLGKTEPVKVQNEYYLPVKAHGVHAMSIGYLTEGEPALVWRGPMLAKSLIQMLNITQWDELDYLLIDLPPGTGDIQLSLVQKIPLTGAIIITTPQNVATRDAEKAIKMFTKTNVDIIGIIENMSTHICTACGHQEAIFSAGGAEDLCQRYGQKLLGQLPLDSRIGQDCEQGIPTAATSANELSMTFIKMALLASIEISKKSLNYANKFPGIVVEKP